MAKFLYLSTITIGLGFILYFHGPETFLIVFALFLIVFVPLIYWISKTQKK
ncbi:hypothetical protein [Cytobacillus gottheilii]|uniref:Uncharacterized protein n=1 Tax=Cytobacillus gottheilii TaxID=859144 RepID=A0ABX8FAH5_9BACI|nr:hypothetical protein [Cytobacillus gottheilii]QVY61306.1 hypothetical protein J1899_20555 [Cytobacillus gottheilii]